MEMQASWVISKCEVVKAEQIVNRSWPVYYVSNTIYNVNTVRPLNNEQV